MHVGLHLPGPRRVTDFTALFYPGKVHGTLNGRRFAPETAADLLVMVNPFYPNILESGGVGIPLAPGTRAICDSQAFQTWQTRIIGKRRTKRERMTPWEAVDAQLAFQQRLRDDGCGQDFNFEAVVTYDKLVDEAVVNGKQIKRRASEVDAEGMVEETLRSAYVYKHREDDFAGAIAYAAQGATLRQYMDCVRELLTLMRPGRDWLALGGFCIIGMQPTLKPLFVAVCREVAPLLNARGIRRVHVLGVCVCDALREAAAISAAYGITLSTDSTSMEMNALVGKEWDEDNMSTTAKGSAFVKRFGKVDKLAGYHPAELAMRNIVKFTRWFAKQGAWSKPRRALPAMQESLFFSAAAG
jgi:hypothetical protein